MRKDTIMKKFTNLFFAVAMCLSLCACGTAEENLKKSNEKESINNEEPANNENSIKVEESENIKDSANVEDSVVNEDSINVTASNSQNEKPFEPYVFYREDYEIPDVFNTGYTNMIDYYNASPNGIGMKCCEKKNFIIICFYNCLWDDRMRLKGNRLYCL